MRPALDPRSLAAANINPHTGLATDYLNHFNEAIMMLEMLPSMPDCIDDLIAWQPRSYCEHFAASGFTHRELAIAAYEAAHPDMRAQLDELADVMNAILVSTGEAMRKAGAGGATGRLAEEALNRLKPLVARAGAVINGAAAQDIVLAETDVTQAAVDALLRR